MGDGDVDSAKVVGTSLQRQVGISLSGGGLRAASFGLGALQALDQSEKLLRGETAATFIAAVSGGSYIASTLALVNAGAAARYCDGEPLGASDVERVRPLAQGSPEVSHILRHSRYLVEDGGWLQGLLICIVMLANVLTLLGLIASMALGLAFAAYTSICLRFWLPGGSQGWEASIPNVLVLDPEAELTVTTAVGGAIWWLSIGIFLLSLVAWRSSAKRWSEYVADRFAWIEQSRASDLDSTAVDESGSPSSPSGGARGRRALRQWRSSRRARVRRTKQARREFDHSHRRRRARLIAVRWTSAVLLFWTLPDVVAAVVSFPLTGSPEWLIENFAIVATWILGLLGCALALIAVGSAVARRMIREIGLSLAGLVAQAVPLATLVLFFCWSLSFGIAVLEYAVPVMVWPVSTAFESTLEPAFQELSYLGIMGVYVGMAVLPQAIAGALAKAPSAHEIYRKLLTKCFGVGRGSDFEIRVVDPKRDVALSSLHVEGAPDLLICAAANVTDAGSALAGINALPLVFSSDCVRIPAIAGATLPMRAVERPGVYGPGGKVDEPESQWPFGLSSAVAVTGAAVSPTMGRHTRAQLRPLLAMLGVRLGRWLPNPASPQQRLAVVDRELSMPRSVPRLVLKELLGQHSSRDPVVYASDGGHFENMGLVELLRRQCGTIWVIDASPHLRGHPLSLTESILLAEAETGCKIDLDLSKVVRATDSGRFQCVVAVGSVTYMDGTTGTIRVVKLGITPRHSSVVKNYEILDRGFPFHATINQVYSADRFGAYRRLGWESMQQLLLEVRSQAASPN